ncbi:MAG: TIGR03943 family putative permease subunit [Pseudonocardiaceae bacterium]
MNRETQSLVTLLVGGAALRISVTDVYLRYVKSELRPFLIAAAVILIVIGAVTLWREVFGKVRSARVSGAGECHTGSRHVGRHRSKSGLLADGASSAADGAHDEHGHHHGGPWVAWLLVLPVFAIFLIAPPSLGSYAAERAGTSVTAPVDSDYPPLPAGDPVPMTLLDYATRATFEGDASLKGRTVKLSGFVSKREGGGVRLTRMILTCCAADGRPVKVTIIGQLPRKLPSDTWVSVEGKYDKRSDADPSNGEKIPYLRVTSLHKIAKPADPYEE